MPKKEFDTSGLEAKKMNGEKLRGFPAYRYFRHGSAVAQTCTTCSLVFSLNDFPVHGSRRVNSCRDCTRLNRDKRRKGYANLSRDEVLNNRDNKYPDGKKKCNRCLEYKEFSEFYEMKINTCWLAKECTPCVKAQLPTFSSYSEENRKSLYKRKRERNLSRSDEEVYNNFLKINPSGVKKCRSCQRTTPFGGFHPNRGVYVGVQAYCILCDTKLRALRKSKYYVKYWNDKEIPVECYMCAGPYEDIEHIVPITLEGPDVPGNTRPSCRNCNRGPGGKYGEPMETYIYKINHPVKSRAEIIEGLMLDGAWPFSVEYGSKEWGILRIANDPEFSHLFNKL